ADYNNHRIQRFDRNLNFVSTLVNDTSRELRLQFGFPVAVAYSRFGEIFIAELEHNRILKFDINGNPVQSFGDYDWGAGSLEEPVQIGISGKDAIFVADAMRKAVIKFDYYGNYLQEFPLDDFTSLDAIAVSSGYLFALDARKQRIFVLTTDGELLTDFLLDSGLPAKDPASNGLDIAIAGKMLYILDGAAGVIQCFHLQKSGR
ncbi:MAG: NHL repeat-containing protein, partial [bacterium]